jgi:hypothetical protein
MAAPMRVSHPKQGWTRPDQGSANEMTAVTASGRGRRARDNSEYLRRLLSEKHPDYLAMLQAAERQVDFELSRADQDCRARPDRKDR